MRRATVGIALVQATLIVAMPLLAYFPPDDPKTPKRPNVEITEAHYKKKLRVKKGDVIEVKLKAGLTSYWAQDGANSILRKLKGPKAQPIPRDGALPTQDGRYICVNLFEVIKDTAVPMTLKLMYCQPPSEAERLEGLKPKDPTDLAFWTRRRIDRKEINRTEFRPELDVSKLHEGTIFKVELQTNDESAKAQDSPSNP